ncbi:MAG TPA: FCD domain-containing protein [Bryobacteraceae bacterium]|jgi:GntR family transcriptional repressor for pyruvate dehydrogenase complex|nr:FCD domain-containing protein [Bryobacteraceae bacterium]
MHHDPFSRTNPESLTQSIVNEVRELIRTGELSLGSKLPPERELAHRLGVSRASLRQGVKALEQMGLVVSRVGVGNFVSEEMGGANLLSEPMQFAIQMKNISGPKLFELRRLLEVQVAGLTATRATDADIAMIERELRSMETHRADPREMADADYRFHLAIIKACGNEIFELIYAPISKTLWEDLRERMSLFDAGRIIELHHRIFQAIAARDAAMAMKAMEEHLEIGYSAVFGKAAAIESQPNL